MRRDSCKKCKNNTVGACTESPRYRKSRHKMDRLALPCFSSTATFSLSWTQTEEHEDCSSLYCELAITETLGDHNNPVQKGSVVTGVAAISKEQLKKSLLVTGRIEHKTLHHKPSCLKT